MVWQDSADYQWRIALGDLRGPHELARAHPLFIALAYGLHRLTGIEPALAGNIMSALSAAVAVANVFVIARLLGSSQLASTAAAAALAMSHTFWQFATMTETYTLVGALMSGEILCLTLFARTGRKWVIPLCGLANGLGVSNHGLALISLACYVAIAVIVLRRTLGKHLALAAATAACWLIGFLPLLALIVRQAALPEMTLVDTLRDWLVGRYYASNVFNFDLSFRMFILVAAMIGLSFPSVAVFLVPPGVRRLYRQTPAWLASVPTALFVAHLLFAARYNIVDQYTFFIPTYVAMSILVAAGADRLLALGGRWRALRWPLITTLLWSPLVYAMLPVIMPRIAAHVRLPIPTREIPYRDPLRWFLWPWHTGYRGPERFVREALAQLPDDAVLLIDQTRAGPLYYGQVVWGLQPGIQINHERRAGPSQPIDPGHVADWVARGRLYIGGPEHDQFAHVEDRWVREKYGVEREGLLYRVVPVTPSSETED